MKHYFLMISVAILSLLLCQCSSNENTNSEYNEHVVGFTSGNISRKASVFLLLSEDLEVDKLNKIDPNKFMTISPSVEGNFSFSDAHTIMFKPAGEMNYNTSYTITADLDELYDDDSPKFSFSFKTHPFQLKANLNSFEELESGDYIYEFTVNSIDEESIDDVKSVVTCNKEINNPTYEWNSSSPQCHLVKITIHPTKEQQLSLLTIANPDLQLTEESLITVDVPDPNVLRVYDIKYISEETNYIQVTFNKLLDVKQNKKGLAYIVDNESQTVEVNGNKIKLFPDNGKEGTVKVFLSQSIRSKNGLTLKNDETHEVELKLTKPTIEFVDNGTIVPQTDQLIVPFRSIYLKGVKVKVFKIYNKNIASLLQQQNINQCDNLKLLGRPVAVTTFYLDESSDLTKWQTCAIDLSNLVKTEPGCMYRVELDMDHRLTAWPTANFAINKTDISTENDLEMAKLSDEFDGTDNWYYMESNGNWNDYVYKDRENPDTKTYYMNRIIGKNVLATNIGLVAYAPSANKLTVVATDLPNAQPISSLDVTVYNKQSHAIAKGNTDSDGRIDFNLDGKNGTPYYILAQNGNDVSGIRVVRGEELSTSTFKVNGENVTKGLKGYIYGERGVWRPGDTIFLSFMLNDREKTLPSNHPVVLEISNPLGQLYTKQTKTSNVNGIYTFTIPTEASVPTGSWLANIQVGGAAFSKRLRIETIKPNRLKIDLSLPEILEVGTQKCPMHTEWLSGGKTHNLKYQITSTIVNNSTTFTKWPDYTFNDCSKIFNSTTNNIANGITNNEGDASVTINMPKVENAPGKLRCTINTSVYEESGEFSTDAQIVDYSPYETYVGIKAPTNNKYGFLTTGKSHNFSIVTVNPYGDIRNNVSLLVEVFKLQWYWWWNSNNNMLAEYTNSDYHEPVKRMTITTDSKGKGSFSLNFKDKEWGTYYIRVTDKDNGHSTGIKSYFDWEYMTSPRSSDGCSTAVTMNIKTDKEEYTPDETITVTLPSTEGSRAILSICNSAGIIDMKFVECQGSNTTVTFQATNEMMPNAYIVASVIQPYNHTQNNDVPIRLYGVQPILVNSAISKLNPVISSNDETKPLTEYEVTVSEKEGRPMAYTLAIVDEGLLDLTRFKTPNAWPTFNAKEALGLRIWDLYNDVCGAFGGKIDQTFSVGGDEALYNGPKAIVNRFTPMVYFKGPFLLNKDEKKTHKVQVPNYIGRVRVMVVAGDGSAYGSADKSVKVNKPLMVIGTLPRQVGVNDEMTVSATVFASDKSVRDVKTTLSCSNNLTIIGNNSASLNFTETGNQTIQFRVKAGNKEGTGKITINSSCSSDKASYTVEIPIRSVSQKITQSSYNMVKAGASYKSTVKAPGSNAQKIQLEVSSVQSLNLASRTADLIANPHCGAEQIISSALSQLYLKDFADLSDEQKVIVDKAIKNTIAKLANYQTNDGGISYWPNGSYPNPWNSAHALLFLDKATEKGYVINNSMMSRLKNYVTTQAKNWKSDSNTYDTRTAAFCLYVLANNHSPERGTMNRMKESVNKLTDISKDLLAASYSLTNQNNVAKQIINQYVTNDESWYNTNIAHLIAQTLLDDVNAAINAEKVRQKLASDEWISSFETAFAIHAMQIFYKKNGTSNEMNFNVSANKENSTVKTLTMTWNKQLAENNSSVDLLIENKGTGSLYVSTHSEGIATQEQVNASENGLKVNVSFDNMASMEQGKTINLTYTITNTSGQTIHNIAVTHILPAGFEILSSIDNQNINYQDKRDDRILSYCDVLKNGQQAIVHLTLSATYAGTYYVPAITAECLNNNKIFGCSSSSYSTIK